MYDYNPSVVVAFMGVDGSGKSTLVKKLSYHLKNNYKKTKNLHLRPYFFLTDKRTVVSKPHQQKNLRSQTASLFIILTWLFIYRIFFFLNLRKKNQLIIFDRYAHDLLIDKVRYRYNLSEKITKFILSFFPEPHLWIFLKSPIKLIEKRKKELPTKELKRQMKEYSNFFKIKSNVVVVNTSLKIKKNILLIERKMKSIV
jgi:thymidylate kinase